MYRSFFSIIVAAVLILALGMQVCFSQEKATAKLDADKIMHKFDEVISAQNEILKELGEIKQELAIIKVRASRR